MKKIKKVVAAILAISVFVSGCARPGSNTSRISSVVSSNEERQAVYKLPGSENPGFEKLSDPELIDYLEDTIYAELVDELGSDYYVEGVNAVYVSQEYLDELAYNSKSNIYFGYTLEELDKQFEGKKYTFTVGENNETIAKEFEPYDTTYDTIIKNVAIGTGVILICVTVSAVTATAGAPAVALIFSTAAKTGTVAALSGGVISGISAGFAKSSETNDLSEILQTAALSASDGFKWGAVSGAISGGAVETFKYAKAMKVIKEVNLNYLTKQEAAYIQMKSKFPAGVINEFHSVKEYEVFEKAGLTNMMVNNKSMLVRHDIDLKQIDSKTGMTNLELMKKGYAPYDKTGIKFELHHVGQENNGTLAILTSKEHDEALLHGYKAISEVDRSAFDGTRKNIWIAMSKLYESGALK